MRRFVLFGIIGAFLAGGVTVGLIIGLDSDNQGERVDSLLEEAREVYDTRAGEQARLDTEYQRCSKPWVSGTASAIAEGFDEFAAGGFAESGNFDAFLADVEGHLAEFCDTFDIESYCEAIGRSVLKHYALDFSVEDLAAPCVEAQERDVAATFDIEVGDCFLETTGGLVPVPCSEPGAVEAITIWQIPDATLPSLTRLDGYASIECPADVFTYTHPTEESWQVGDRSLVCFAER